MTDTGHPRLYLDTNIFIHVFENGHRQLIDLLAGTSVVGERFLFTSELTLAELIVKPVRDGDDELRQIYENWTRPNDVLDVGAIDRQVLIHAAALRAQYRFLKLPDAIHLSTAIGFECTHFVSFDRQLDGLDRISVARWGLSRTSPMPRFICPDDDGFSDLTRHFC